MFSKILKKGQINIGGQTTSKYGQIFTIWPQKGQVPNLGNNTEKGEFSIFAHHRIKMI